MTVDDASGFAGRVALVTGASGGIGGAVAAALSARGAAVIAADVAFDAASPDVVDALAPDLAVRLAAALDAGSVRVRLDVRSRDASNAVAAAAARAGRAIGIVVNGAGVVSFGAASTLAEAEWDRVLAINLKGSFLVAQAAIAEMKARRFGRIVNIGSVVARNAGNARPWIAPAELERAGNVAYGVSKAGVHAMTAYLAKELAAHGITVNAVAPGPIATAMTTAFPDALRALIPVGRMGTLDDVVRAILFLADPAAGFVTGAVLDVNGGLVCG